MAISNSTDRFNGYVASLAMKAPCVVATNANITLFGEQTVNSIAVVSGDRVLVKDQTSAIENGIYEVRASAWERTPDFDGNRDVTGDTVVLAGVSGGDPLWYRVTGVDPYRIGTDQITWAELTVGSGSAGITPTPSADQVAFWTDALNIEGSAGLTWDDVAKALEILGNSPALKINQSNAGANLKRWKIYASAGSLFIVASNDADDTDSGYLRLNRSAGVATDVLMFVDINLADQRLIRSVLNDYSIQQTDYAPTGASLALVYSDGPVFDVSLESASGNITLSITGGPPSTRHGQVTVRVVQDSAAALTVTWGGADTYRHAGGVAHPMNTTLSGVTVYTLETFDAGASWEVGGADYS